MPRFIAQTLAGAWVWSVVLTTTASMSFWSKSFRQSAYCLALGYGWAACASRLASTSHNATMFSVATDFVLDPPRPLDPMMPMLSFSLGERHWAFLPVPGQSGIS